MTEDVRRAVAWIAAAMLSEEFKSPLRDYRGDVFSFDGTDLEALSEGRQRGAWVVDDARGATLVIALSGHGLRIVDCETMSTVDVSFLAAQRFRCYDAEAGSFLEGHIHDGALAVYDSGRARWFEYLR